MTLEELKKKYPNFLMGLDEVYRYIEWYERNGGYTTDWDNTRYAFALDAVKYIESADYRKII